MDHASFADLVGVALNVLPSGGGAGTGSQANTTAITLTPYTVLSAIVGAN